MVSGIETNHIKWFLNRAKHIKHLSKCSLAMIQKEYRVQINGRDLCKGFHHNLLLNSVEYCSYGDSLFLWHRYV